MKLPTSTRGRIALVGTTLALAAASGGVASHQLIGSDAAQQTAFTRAAGPAQKNLKAKVPFLGPFSAQKKHGTVCGPAVRLMEGALRRTTPPIRKTKAANCVGAATVIQLIKFQSRHHIPPSGIYGLRTHEALSHAYSAEQRRDLVYLAAIRLERKEAALHRTTIGIVTAHAKAHEGVMGYCNAGHLGQCSLRAVWPAWPDVPRHTDCSGYVSWVYFQSGLASPNGTSYPGNTTSLWRHGKLVSAKLGRLQVGDLVFYAYNNSHVAIYIGRGLVSSHGQSGIKIVAWNYRYVYGVRRYFASS